MTTTKATDAPRAAKKLLSYHEPYLQSGFTVTSGQRPQGLVCAEVLANNSMKPLNLNV